MASIGRSNRGWQAGGFGPKRGGVASSVINLPAPFLTMLTTLPLPSIQITGPDSQQIGDRYFIEKSQNGFVDFEQASALVTSLVPPNAMELNWGSPWELGATSVRGYYVRAGQTSLIRTITTTIANAPVASAPVGSATGETAAQLACSTTLSGGNMKVVASTSATPPSGPQVIAGQDHTGSAAAGTATQAVAASGAQVVPVTGLAHSSQFYLHAVHDMGGGVYSNVISSGAVWTFLPDTYIGKQSTADGGVTIDTTNDKIVFNTIAAGAAHPRKRLLILAAHNGGATQHTGFNGSGLTFSKLMNFSTADDTANANNISAWIADCPAGGNITGIELLYSNVADAARAHIAVYVIGRPGAVTAALKAFSASANNLGGTIDVAAAGALFGISCTSTDANGNAWTGLTDSFAAYKISATWYAAGGYFKNTGAALTARAIDADWTVNPSANIRLGVLAFGAQA